MNTQPSPRQHARCSPTRVSCSRSFSASGEPTDETELIESDSVTIVVSESVIEELLAVSERRAATSTRTWSTTSWNWTPISRSTTRATGTSTSRETTPSTSGTCRWTSLVGDRREILRDLRTFVRAAGRRVEYLESLLADQTVDPIPPLELRFAMDGILNHDADTKIVTDAAAWTADGGSGVLVTRDSDHIRQNESRINELLTEEQGPRGRCRSSSRSTCSRKRQQRARATDRFDEDYRFKRNRCSGSSALPTRATQG